MKYFCPKCKKFSKCCRDSRSELCSSCYIKTLTKHSSKGTRLYVIWDGIKRRCLDEKNKDFKKYGGSGIKLCNDWLEFLTFKKWSYENGYSEDLSIDRKNERKGYEPNNCRWVDVETQNQNRGIMKNNTSGSIGINFNKKCNKWESRIHYKGKRIHLGVYEDINNAIQVRNDYILKNKTNHRLN